MSAGHVHPLYQQQQQHLTCEPGTKRPHDVSCQCGPKALNQITCIQYHQKTITTKPNSTTRVMLL